LLPIAVLVANLSASAQGCYEALNIQNVGGGVGAANGTAGWAFQPTTEISVISLGCLDNIFQANSTDSVSVGLWDSGGALLSSITVTPSSQLVSSTRYESVAPVFLAANQTYHIGAYNPLGVIAYWVADNTYFQYFTTSPSIQLRGFAAASGGFVFPKELEGGTGIVPLGPNFQYTVVPEPSCIMLLGAGGMGILLGRKLNR